MRKILETLEKAYGYPIDIEFTVNFRKNGEFRINILQCRPMQSKGLGQKVSIPKSIPKDRIIFQTVGNFLGGNVLHTIDRIVYVDPKAYTNLASQSEKYDIARLVGAINKQIGAKDKMSVMMLGPGRWGTTTPSLGVPVSFAEINNITVLGELAFTTANASPEISFGTHFFQDLVETGIFYLALFPDDHNVYMYQKFFDNIPRDLKKTLPQYSKYSNVVKIFDAKGKVKLKIVADILSQKLVFYRQ
jgi:hypothetical protein